MGKQLTIYLNEQRAAKLGEEPAKVIYDLIDRAVFRSDGSVLSTTLHEEVRLATELHWKCACGRKHFCGEGRCLGCTRKRP